MAAQRSKNVMNDMIEYDTVGERVNILNAIVFFVGCDYVEEAGDDDGEGTHGCFYVDCESAMTIKQILKEI